MLVTADNPLSVQERDAFALSQAAGELEQARTDETALGRALSFNLALWTSIRSLAAADEAYLPATLRERLPRLFDHVADTTRRPVIADDAVDALIRLDLELSEGLLYSLFDQQQMLKRA